MRFALIVLALGAASATAEEHVVSQKNKRFSAPKLTVKVGDTVGFRNDDPFFHNIFSLSPTEPFDLGTFPNGQTRKITFKKEGRVEIECAIHPEMKMVVEVKK